MPDERYLELLRAAREPLDMQLFGGWPVRPTEALQTALSPASVRTDLPETLRHERIQVAAYFRAEKRGFAAGFELADWLTAEAEVDEVMRDRQS